MAIGIGAGLYTRKDKFKLWFWGVFSSIMPDFDVIGFKFGIAYESMWGHRGFTHSIFFAVVWSIFLALILFKKSRKGLLVAFIYLFICTLSHGFLDAMTTGGHGVGFFIPFDETRHFFPWRMIRVSPMSISRFFSEWGMRVLKSEAIFIMIPSLIIGIFSYFVGRKYSRNRRLQNKDKSSNI